MKSKLLLLFLSLFAFVGGVKAQNWKWTGESRESMKAKKVYVNNVAYNTFVSGSGTTTTLDVTEGNLLELKGNGNNNHYYIANSSGTALNALAAGWDTPSGWSGGTNSLYMEQVSNTNGDYVCTIIYNAWGKSFLGDDGTKKLNNKGSDGGDAYHWRLISIEQMTAYTRFSGNLAKANELLNNANFSADEKAVITAAKNRLGTTVKWTDDALADFNTVIEVAKAGHPLVVTRSSKIDRYGTICLPYDFTVDGAEILQIDEVTNSIIDANGAGSHSAGVPYLYKANKATQSFTMKVENAASTTTTLEDQYLVGTFTNVSVPQNSYLLQTQGDRQAFYIVQSNTLTCGKYKCYMKADTDNTTRNENVKGLFFSEEDMATAIDAIENSANADAQIFDLSGRKLDRLQKGINIVGGKKIIVK